MTFTPRIGTYGALGYAKEATFGTPLAATTYVPFKDLDFSKDPGLKPIEMARQQRELTTYLAAGEQKITGKGTFSLFSVMGMALLVGGIGIDAYQTGSAPASTTTLSATANAGQNQIVLTSATGYAVGNVVQVDTAASKIAELGKITAIATNTLTLDRNLTSQHLSGATVAVVTSPYTHNIQEANTLSSFTLEENVGGASQSVQYAGATVDKIVIKGATKNEVEATFDFLAQSDLLIPPTTAVFSADQPCVLAGINVSLLGAADANVESFEIDLQNNIKPQYTFSGKRYPTALPATGRKVWMKVTEAFQDYTYYNQLASATLAGNPPAGANTVTCNAGADTITFNFPQVSITKLGKPQKVGSVVMSDIEFMAWLGNQTSSFSMTVANTVYQPF